MRKFVWCCDFGGRPLFLALACGVLAWTAPSTAQAAILEVGPGKPYATPCAALAAAAAGDVIEVDASGDYTGDVCIWPGVDQLTLRGVNGRPSIDANGANAGGKGVWVVNGTDITIENVEITGATVPDHNGAAIRLEGTNLTLRGVYFHDNENGLLAGDNADSEIVIEHSEFANNGYGDGFTHNIYVNRVARFIFRYSYSHHAIVGHTLKSRAHETQVLYSRLMTEDDGNSSYLADFPNGGTVHVIGNLFQQGENTGNSGMLSYGAEGLSNPTDAFFLVNNSFVNDRPIGVFVRSEGVTPAVVRNNIMVGNGDPITQAGAIVEGNHVAEVDGDPLFVDQAGFDYTLQAGSPCEDMGVDPGMGGGLDLTPVAQYVHPADMEARSVVDTIDIGAYELGGASGDGDGDGDGDTGTGDGDGAETAGEDSADGGDTSGVGDTGGSSEAGSGGDGETEGSGDTGTPSPGSDSDTEGGCACDMDGGRRSVEPLWLGALLFWRRRALTAR